MNLIKKLLCFSLLLSVGCSKIERPPASDKKKILSTIAQIGDLVAEVGGDRIESQVLVRGELNPHSYELVKGDGEKIQSAEIVFCNGLGLEHGASVAAMLQNHSRAVALGEKIRTLHPEKIIWNEGVPDPHIWMDVSLWKESVPEIVESLSAIDPEGKEYYAQKGAALEEKLDAAHQEIYSLLQKVPSEKRYLVTSHDAFHYFTRSYLADPNEADWERRFAAPEGLSPDGQLNPMDLQKIIDHMHRYRIEILFPESNVSRDSIRKIALAGKKLGLRLRICEEALYGDAMQGKYIDAMKHNADAIARHLEAE